MKKPKEIVIYVAPGGDDEWSGRRASPNRAGTDGPLATIKSAQKAARRLRKAGKAGESVRIVLRGGCYALKKPLVLTGQDSGTGPVGTKWRDNPAQPLTFSAYRKERPVISGGRRITGWRKEKLNGRTVWTARIPGVKQGRWYFRQLFVNGQRRRRPRLPREGFFSVAGLAPTRHKGTSWRTNRNDKFHYREGDILKWRNLKDVEVVTLEKWVDTRLWLRSLDQKKRLARFDRATMSGITADPDTPLRERTAYYVENMFEALERPGEWYLDRGEGKLYYLPLPGESIRTAEVFAPVLDCVLRIEGNADGRSQPRHIRFEGITFAHTEWRFPPEEAASEQAARGVPGAIRLRNARDIEFKNCSVVNVGTYGVELQGLCRDNLFEHCTVADLGAGGFKMWHGVERTAIKDCEIGGGGEIFHSAVGVLIGQSSGNKVLHNHIHDFRYSGVSVGWRWGYEDGDAYGNIVEYNHIHDIGYGYLSDMGGIYTLGPSQGTRLRYNLIHDVRARGYGGWGIYPDEGTTDMLIENNIVYDCNRASFHQHYGKDNVVRNNIFAFGGDRQIAISRAEAHRSVIFENNIVYYDGEPEVFADGYANEKWVIIKIEFDRNMYCHAGGRRPTFAGRSLADWRKLGRDVNGRIADPLFVNAAKRDFRLKRTSPALQLGFVPIDLAGVGPRGSGHSSS